MDDDDRKFQERNVMRTMDNIVVILSVD